MLYYDGTKCFVLEAGKYYVLVYATGSAGKVVNKQGSNFIQYYYEVDINEFKISEHNLLKSALNAVDK